MSRRLTLVVIAVGAALGGYLLGALRPTTPLAPPRESVEARQLWTCGMHPQVLQDKSGLCPICGMALTPVGAGVESSAGGAGPAVTIDPVVVQNMGVRIAPVREGPLRFRLRAAGYLGEAEPRRHDVNLRVSGWIERLHIETEGSHVAAGDPLFDLYSPEIHVAVEELIAARRAGNAFAGAAARKLRLWGLGEAQIDRLARLDRAPTAITFLSPVHGHVVEKRVVAGAAVKAGARVLRIVDHSVLWLDAQVFEQDLPLVRLGQTATASFPGRPDERFEGRVVFIHPHVEDMTRAAAVRLEIANPALTLRPGMYGTIELVGERSPHAVQVPREAVIDTGEQQVVFVTAGEGRFEPRRVRMGTVGEEGEVEITDGLQPGETVVTSGQFLLEAESRFKEAIAKHLASQLARPPAESGPRPSAPMAPGHAH
jgi:multidrug efflux pump subunit AcrA (membrane-fusion protein)